MLESPKQARGTLGYMSMCLCIGWLWSKASEDCYDHLCETVRLSFGSSSIWIWSAWDTGIFPLNACVWTTLFSPSQLFSSEIVFNILHGHALCMHESHVCNAYINAPKPENVLLWDSYASRYGNILLLKRKLVLVTPLSYTITTVPRVHHGPYVIGLLNWTPIYTYLETYLASVVLKNGVHPQAQWGWGMCSEYRIIL